MAESRRYIVFAYPRAFVLKCAVLARGAVMHTTTGSIPHLGPRGAITVHLLGYVRAFLPRDGVANGPAWAGVVVFDRCY